MKEKQKADVRECRTGIDDLIVRYSIPVVLRAVAVSLRECGGTPTTALTARMIKTLSKLEG